jgi:hypothetical protein
VYLPKDILIRPLPGVFTQLGECHMALRARPNDTPQLDRDDKPALGS